jgi:hypothetical protein
MECGSRRVRHGERIVRGGHGEWIEMRWTRRVDRGEVDMASGLKRGGKGDWIEEGWAWRVDR